MSDPSSPDQPKPTVSVGRGVLNNSTDAAPPPDPLLASLAAANDDQMKALAARLQKAVPDPPPAPPNVPDQPELQELRSKGGLLAAACGAGLVVYAIYHRANYLIEWQAGEPTGVFIARAAAEILLTSGQVWGAVYLFKSAERLLFAKGWAALMTIDHMRSLLGQDEAPVVSPKVVSKIVESAVTGPPKKD